MRMDTQEIVQEAELAVEKVHRAVEAGPPVILDNLALEPGDAQLDGSQQKPSHDDAIVLSQWRLAACRAMRYAFRKEMRNDLFGRRNSDVRRAVEDQAETQSQASLQALRGEA